MLESQNKSVPQGADALKQFQLTTGSIQEKSSKEYGLALAKYIASTCSFSTGSYYYTRNARYIKNRNYVHGTMDIQAMFQDRFQFNGKQNYISLNWNALQMPNRIISGLVGRWMKRNEKIQVTAIDTLSITQKKEQYEEMEALVLNRRELEALSAESGVDLIPKTGIPEDEEELRLLQPQIERLPEEILTEMGCNDVLSSNGFFDILKEKALHDAGECLFVGTYTWMDSDGVVHVRLVKPENAIYSFTEQNDLRDTSWRGEAPPLKISEIRRQWGKEFNPNNPLALDEMQLWEIAQKCKEYQYQTNIGWNDIYYTSFFRPYDEWNVRSLQFEVKTVDTEPYTVTKTKNGATYTQKGYPITKSGKPKEKPSENQNIIGDSNWNIYRGVYLQDCDMLLEWGLKDNMIRPQDPAEIGNAEFSYTYVMPQNYMMTNMAIPQKIEAAIDGMILACLKIQQDIAGAIPPGWVVDETALQNIDYGLGNDGNNAVDQSKLFFQTGRLFYRGLDAEGNRVPVPIQEIANSGFAAHVESFIKTYQFWYQTLKDELGEDPNLISAALQPRVTADNVEASQLQAEYATDYVFNAYKMCMALTAKKVSCLLKDSVSYGGKAYRTILQKEDVANRIFTTKIQMLPTEFEVQKFEALMNQVIAANPDIQMFVNPFELTRIAKEDVKLAEMMFRNGQKKMLMHREREAKANQEATFKAQVESGRVSEEEKRKTKEEEGKVEVLKAQMTGDAQAKNTLLSGIMAMYQKQQETGTAMPIEMQAIARVVLENVAVPAMVQNEQQKQMILQQMAQDMAEEQMMKEQEMQMQQQNQQQPQVAV